MTQLRYKDHDALISTSTVNDADVAAMFRIQAFRHLGSGSVRGTDPDLDLDASIIEQKG
jgi:hypothetical protein